MMPKILVIKNFNHETENKATPVDSTALTFMSLLSGEVFKNKVRSLPILFKISHVYQHFKLYTNVINELFQILFYKQVDPPVINYQ